MRLSPRGIRRIGGEEWNGKNGLRADGRYYQYLDYKSIPTIGIGCRVFPGDDYSRGLTLDEVLALFHAKQRDVYAAIARNVIFPINQAQFDSMCSTGHNCGTGFFVPAQCTAVRLLNESESAAKACEVQGDADGAARARAAGVDAYCTHMLDWNKSGDPARYDPILAGRRGREAEWFREAPPTDELLFTDAERAEILAVVGAQADVDVLTPSRSGDNP